MNFRAELVRAVVWNLTGVALTVGLYFACVSPTSHTSAFRPGFLEANDLPEDFSVFGGGIDDTYDRRLAGASDVPFIQNMTNKRCVADDRIFAKSNTDLPGCFAKCQSNKRCNHFSMALSGPSAGRCIGCEHGLVEDKTHFVLYTMQKNEQETTFSCPDGLVSSVNLDTLVDGDRPYELCITKDGDDEPTCFDLRKGDQAAASITTCVASSSTSTSTTMTTSSTSNTMTTSSTSTSTSNTMTTSSTSTSTSTAYRFVPRTRDELKSAVDMWLTNKPEALDRYGEISTWSTSKITSMWWLFCLPEGAYFDDNISSWDVSRVTNMDSMFRGVRGFKQNLSAWNVSKVETMAFMFIFTMDFDVVLSSWDVRNVLDMQGMFEGASNFHANLAGWNPINVTTMGYMFYTATDTHLEEVGAWNLRRVLLMDDMFAQSTNVTVDMSLWKSIGFSSSFGTSMSRMFMESDYNQDISKWDTGAVRTMYGMFKNNAVFNQDVGSWDVSKVVIMRDMFNGASAFNGSIGTWNVSKVTYMEKMFQDAKAFSQDISGWDVGRVEDMHSMFDGADAFLDVDVSVWTPLGLTSAPSNFISPESIACTKGDWKHWGSNRPSCE